MWNYVYSGKATGAQTDDLFEAEEEEEEDNADDDEGQSRVIELAASEIRYEKDLDPDCRYMKERRKGNDYEYGKCEIVDVACTFFRTWVRHNPESQASVQELLKAFKDWLNLPVPDRMGEKEIPDLDLWQNEMYRPEVAQFARIARTLVSLPCSEAASERRFSVKRHIIGQRSMRTNTRLLSARTRLAMMSEEDSQSD